MCAAIMAYIPFIIVINTNVLNRRTPAVKYDHTMAFTSSTITSARCRQIILKLPPVDLIPLIFRGCVCGHE